MRSPKYSRTWKTTRRAQSHPRICIAYNKAQLLLAKLGAADEDKRKGMHLELQDLANQLVDLDANYLELKAEQLDRELGQVRDQIVRIRDQLASSSSRNATTNCCKGFRNRSGSRNELAESMWP